MTKVRAKKGSPLLLLVVLAIAVGIVGAQIMWQSQSVTYEFSVVGMDARVLDATFAGYSAQTATTTLKSEALSTTNSDPVTNAFVIVYDGGSVTSDVLLSLDVTILHNGELTTEMTWTATVNYICYFIDSIPNDYMYLYDSLGALTETGGYITIPYADLAICMDYGITPPSLNGDKTDAGGIVIQFAFDAGTDGLWGDFAIDIVASLGT